VSVPLNKKKSSTKWLASQNHDLLSGRRTLFSPPQRTLHLKQLFHHTHHIIFILEKIIIKKITNLKRKIPIEKVKKL